MSTHPGIILKDTLEDMELSNKEFAIRLGKSESYVSQILSGQKKITKNVAKLLETVLGISAKFWLNLVTNYELERDLVTDNLDSEKIKMTVKDFPYNDLRKIGFLPRLSMFKDKFFELLKFFGASSIADLRSVPSSISFRKSKSITDKNYGQIRSWIRMVELMSYETRTETFDIEAFKITIEQIRDELRFIEFEKDNIEKYLQEKLSKCGVAYMLAPKMQGAGISGYISKDGEKVIFAQTNLGNMNDKFWFTFFHEAAHVLYDLSDNCSFLDIGEIDYDVKDEKEQRANNFAKELLINTEAYSQIFKSDFSKESIIFFSDKLKIPPGVIVGRLQHEGAIEWNDSRNTLKKKFKQHI